MRVGTIILILILLVVTGLSVRGMSAARRDLAVAEANERAALDTTRTHLRDSVAASTRLAVQAAIIPDSVSDALAEALQDRDANLVAFQRSEIAFDSVVALGQVAAVDTVFVEGEDTIRVVTFELEGPPIRGEQVVKLTPGTPVPGQARPLSVTLDSRLVVSPFSITYGIACQNNDPVFAWKTPDWVTATFAGGTVEPDVCYTPPPTPILSISVGKSVWLAAGVAVGYLLSEVR